MSRSLDAAKFLDVLCAVLQGTNDKVRAVREDLPGLGMRLVIEGGTFARENFAGFVESTSDPSMMAQILIRGIGVAPAKVNVENSLQIFAAIQPEGWLFRRKTGSGTAYFAISAVKVDAAASDALSSLFEDAIPAAAPKKAAKKAAK